MKVIYVCNFKKLKHLETEKVGLIFFSFIPTSKSNLVTQTSESTSVLDHFLSWEDMN